MKITSCCSAFRTLYNEVRNQDLAATILQFLLYSPTRFYSWDTCRNLQRNQSQWTWTSSQWWLLVWFGSTRQDNSSSLQYGNRRSVTLRVRKRSSQGYVHAVPNSFFVATRKVLRYSMNSNDTELEKFVHTHQTSCRQSCWPRGFGSLNVNHHFQSFRSSRLSTYLLLLLSEDLFTPHQSVPQNQSHMWCSNSLRYRTRA